MVFDMGDGYKSLCENMGGVYLDGETLRFNPFANITDIDQSAERVRDQLSVMASPNGNLDEVHEGLLLQAVRASWLAKENRARIDDVVDFLKNASDSEQYAESPTTGGTGYHPGNPAGYRPANEGGAMRCRGLIALLIWGQSVAAADLGTWGDLWPVKEPDMLTVIMQRLTALEQSGEMGRKMDAFKERVIRNSLRPPAVPGIGRTEKYGSRLFDPSVRLAADTGTGHTDTGHSQ